MSDNQFGEWRQQSGNAAIEDPHQRMLDKLSKLLEVKNRASTESEAATAASLLSRFLTEHNLSMADIERKGGKAPGMREQGHDLGKAAWKWKLDLAEGIAEFYYCAPVVDRTSKTVQFVGRPDNVEALVMLYGWIIDQIKEIARLERRVHFDTTQEHIDPLRWLIGFGDGATGRLITRLRELKARQQEDMSRDEMGNVTALTIHHQSEVNDYLEEKFGYRKDGKPTQRDLKWKAEWEEYEAKQQARREEQDTLRVQCEAAGDMEPYYTAYPRERPDAIAKRDAAYEKASREEAARERRNAKRRTGNYRPGPAIDYDKEEQSGRARASGKAAAGKINLQPFLGGAKDRKKVG